MIAFVFSFSAIDGDGSYLLAIYLPELKPTVTERREIAAECSTPVNKGSSCVRVACERSNALEAVSKLVAKVVKTFGTRRKPKLLTSSATKNRVLKLVVAGVGLCTANVSRQGFHLVVDLLLPWHDPAAGQLVVDAAVGAQDGVGKSHEPGNNKNGNRQARQLKIGGFDGMAINL